MAGILYLVSTPIGNMEDITLRALSTLRIVDVIAAEDPRSTRLLLDRHDIPTTLTSYHNLNKEEKTPVLLRYLKDGKSVALVSDEGTPLVADPGAYLLSRAVREEIRIVPIPGPSAVIAALSASGLLREGFVFHGVVPASPNVRQRMLQDIGRDPRTHVLFIPDEALRAVLEDIRSIIRGATLVLACNLTRADESIIRGTAGTLIKELGRVTLSGDVTLVMRSRGRPSVATRAGRARKKSKKRRNRR